MSGKIKFLSDLELEELLVKNKEPSLLQQFFDDGEPTHCKRCEAELTSETYGVTEDPPKPVTHWQKLRLADFGVNAYCNKCNWREYFKNPHFKSWDL